MLSAAYFYKDIGTYIQNLRETRPYNTTGLPDSLLTTGMPCLLYTPRCV